MFKADGFSLKIFSGLKLQAQEPLSVEIESVYPGWHTQCKEYSYDEDKCFNLVSLLRGVY